MMADEETCKIFDSSNAVRHIAKKHNYSMFHYSFTVAMKRDENELCRNLLAVTDQRIINETELHKYVMYHLFTASPLCYVRALVFAAHDTATRGTRE